MYIRVFRYKLCSAESFLVIPTCFPTNRTESKLLIMTIIDKQCLDCCQVYQFSSA